MAVIAVNPHVLLAVAEEGYLAYDVSADRLHRLNPSAALLMELAASPIDASALANTLAPFVDQPAMCETWITTALHDGLLIDAANAAPPAMDPDRLEARSDDLREQGQVLAAFVCQTAVVEARPDSAASLLRLGELAHIVGRRDDARDAYERYMALEPDDAEIALLLTSLRDEPPPPRAPDRCIEQLYERFASFYEDNMCGELEYQAPSLVCAAVAALASREPAMDVLELGCGTGLAGLQLRPFARELIGIDLSSAMIGHARQTKAYDGLHVAEITSWLRDARTAFHLVVACDTLIYFGDLRQVLMPAAPLLHAGGHVVFTVEQTSRAPFHLTDSGRFAHSRAHIVEAARESGLTPVRIDDAVLRQEYGEPVEGLVVTLMRVGT
jgi:predicted TPR repeat methyltransferase